MELGPVRGEKTLSGSLSLATDDLAFRFTAELLNHGRTDQTAKAYRYSLKAFDDWLKAHEIQALTVTYQDIEQWLADERMRGDDPYTIRNRLQVVRGFYRWLTARGFIQKDPCLYIHKYKVPKRIPNFCTVREVDRMAKACESARERCVVEILYATGMRRGALLALRVQDIDLVDGIVKIVTKGGKGQVLKLGPRSIKAIHYWLKERAAIPSVQRTKTDRLIVGRKGAMSRTQLGVMVHAIAARAGISHKVTPHALRHGFATALMDRNVPLEDVSEMLGHENLQTTMIYRHTSTARLKEAWRKLPRR